MAPATFKPMTSSSLRDGRNEIAFVDSARLVVDVEHASANHDGDVHGEGDGAGKEVFHVLDIGIEFDNVAGRWF